MVLEQILIASVVVSLISFVGIFTLSLRDELLHSLLFLSFAAGTMLGVAFLHLIPESIQIGTVDGAMQIAVFGILSFFMVEKLLHWHHHHGHHHAGEEPEHPPFTYLNLVGDGIHNFVDGTVIAASFLTSPSLGIASTIAIIAHEIPQEIGDFSLLIYGGFSKAKALFFNFLSALTALAGALAAYFFYPYIPGLTAFLLPLAAGHFIYIACVDMVPELHKEKDPGRSAMQLVAMLLGIGVIVAMGMFVHEA
jgi:zinc and cadmium transporter